MLLDPEDGGHMSLRNFGLTVWICYFLVLRLLFEPEDGGGYVPPKLWTYRLDLLVFLLGLIFDPDDGSDRFLLNVGLLPKYTTLYNAGDRTLQ
jgi:hypothetical protein